MSLNLDIKESAWIQEAKRVYSEKKGAKTRVKLFQKKSKKLSARKTESKP